MGSTVVDRLKINTRSETLFLAFASLLFLGTRLWRLLLFPIFNDEAIYLQYAQVIRQNFSQNEFVSVHNMYGDWKPPLQYWIGAAFIRAARDPIEAGRVTAVAFSLIGVFGIYYFVREMFDRRTAIAAVGFYLISSLVLFYNSQFTAETFVFSTAAILYACAAAFLRRWRGGVTAVPLMLAAVVGATALVLFKQSGELPLYLLPLLPFAFLSRERTQADAKGKRKRRASRRHRSFPLAGFAFVGAVILCGMMFSAMAIPSEYAAAKAGFTARWTMTAEELAGFPTAVWLSNLRLVWEMYVRYYGLSTLVLFGLYAAFCFRKRNSDDITLLLLFLSSSAAIVFFLKGFNEYVYHTAVVVFMVPILGRMTILSAQNIRSSALLERAFGYASAACLVATAALWMYQSALIKEDSVAYLRRSSEWAKQNYLTGWSAGYGLDAVTSFLASHKGHGIVVGDPQWGNPRTSLEVLEPDLYPNLVVIPMSQNALRKEIFLKQLHDEGINDNRFFVFSDWFPPGSSRDAWGSYIKENYCRSPMLFKQREAQTPIMVCEF